MPIIFLLIAAAVAYAMASLFLTGFLVLLTVVAFVIGVVLCFTMKEAAGMITMIYWSYGVPLFLLTWVFHYKMKGYTWFGEFMHRWVIS